MTKEKIEIQVKKNIFIKEKDNGKLYVYQNGKELGEYSFTNFALAKYYFNSDEVDMLLHYYLGDNFPKIEVNLKEIAHNPTVFYILEDCLDKKESLVVRGGDEIVQRKIYYNCNGYFYGICISQENINDDPTAEILDIKTIKECLIGQPQDLPSIAWLGSQDTLSTRKEFIKLLNLQ